MYNCQWIRMNKNSICDWIKTPHHPAGPAIHGVHQSQPSGADGKIATNWLWPPPLKGIRRLDLSLTTLTKPTLPLIISNWGRPVRGNIGFTRTVLSTIWVEHSLVCLEIGQLIESISGCRILRKSFLSVRKINSADRRGSFIHRAPTEHHKIFNLA